MLGGDCWRQHLFRLCFPTQRRAPGSSLSETWEAWQAHSRAWGQLGSCLILLRPQLPYLVMGMMALTLQASYAVGTGRAALLLISPLKWIVNNKVMLSTGLALAVGRGPFQGGVCIREGVCPLGALLPVGIVRVLAMTGLNAGLVLHGVMDAVRVQAVC